MSFHSFYYLGTHVPAHYSEHLKIRATETYCSLTRPGRWGCFQVQSQVPEHICTQIFMWGGSSVAHVLTKSNGWETPEALLLSSTLGREKPEQHSPTATFERADQNCQPAESSHRVREGSARLVTSKQKTRQKTKSWHWWFGRWLGGPSTDN